MKTLLVLGATGKTGSNIVKFAIDSKKWNVIAYVRSAARISEVFNRDISTRIKVIEGNLNDTVALKKTILESRPDAIIDASSAIPFGSKVRNDADRCVFYPVLVDALKEGNMLRSCYVICVGGVILPEPGGRINSWFFSTIRAILGFVAPKMIEDANRMMAMLFNETPDEFKFTMARMGQMEEGASRGQLVPEGTMEEGAGPRTSVAYVDVGEALVKLADETDPMWMKKAVFYNYKTA
jgi:NAD(P)H-binding